MTAASIEFRNVTKQYGEVSAVRDVSFTIAPGTLVTLLGPSGCGKTTILRMVAGLELPTGGTIRIGERDVTELPACDRDVSMVFQSYALFPHMTVGENVRFGLEVSGLPKAQMEAKVEAALATVGLGGLTARLPSELSGGQQQRVAVARALVLEPAVLLFDEPLSNLDARLRRQMREEIRELQQRLNLTVVYVTHDQAEALAVSDRIIVMNRAVIAQEGAPRELYAQPSDAFVAGFMGEATRVRGQLVRKKGAVGTVVLGGLEITIPHRNLAEGDIDIAVRPEAISLQAPGATALPGLISKAAYLGNVMEYTVETEVGALFVIDPAVDRPLAAGTKVAVALAPHGVIAIPPDASGGRS